MLLLLVFHCKKMHNSSSNNSISQLLWLEKRFVRLSTTLGVIALRQRVGEKVSWHNLKALSKNKQTVSALKSTQIKTRTRTIVSNTTQAPKSKTTSWGMLIKSQLRVSRRALAVILIILALTITSTQTSNAERMVRLCIASVDPIKLSSQCVMCNRREFPLTVIDCTGITKVNDLIANPLSVQEATCLIYNCRRQVPDVKPEPYHGSVSHAVNYRGAAASSYPNAASGGTAATGSQLYEMMTPSGLYGGDYSMRTMQAPQMNHPSPYLTRFGSSSNFMSMAPTANLLQGSGASMSPLASFAPRGLIGGPSLLTHGRHSQQTSPMPYALIPAPSAFPFGSRKYKAALVPLF